MKRQLLTLIINCILFINSFTQDISNLELLNYDKKFYEISNLNNQPIGIAIICYNRPHYLIKLIKSIEKNPESQTLPFYFFLDGGPKAEQEENSKIINESKIKNKQIIVRDRNYGCAKNQIDAIRFMFDWCKFNTITVIEEDVEISHSYFKLSFHLHAWANQNYSNIGSTRCFSYCLLNERNKKKHLDLVQEIPLSYWWSFVIYNINKEVWDIIKNIIFEYETKFIDTLPKDESAYSERSQPGKSRYAKDIKKWVRNYIINKKEKFTSQNIFFSKELCENLKNIFLSNNWQGNKDAIFAFAFWLNNLAKIETVVNRGRHIGIYGVSSFPLSYQQLKHDLFKLHLFEEDKKIKSFKRIND